MPEIAIRRLSPDLAEEYVRFFDVTPHWDDMDKPELPCYCITWRSDRSYAGDGDHWFQTREERRAKAVHYVQEGSLQGYLAYADGEIVGWCNATGDCQGGVEHLRSYWPIPGTEAGTRVLSVFCFMIDPRYQRSGVATILLQQVCRDAIEEGYTYIEAYTHREYVPPDHRGPLAMYLKCGFTELGERDGRLVVRKQC